MALYGFVLTSQDDKIFQPMLLQYWISISLTPNDAHPTTWDELSLFGLYSSNQRGSLNCNKMQLDQLAQSFL